MSKIGTDMDNINTYEILFSDNIEEVWGDDWNQSPAGICIDLKPGEEYISDKIIIKTSKNIDLAQEQTCFSMMDAIDGIVALAWENMDDYDEYPEERGRLFFKFGETLEKTEEKLAKCGILMIN